MRAFTIPTLLLVASLAVGCTDETAPTAATEAVAGPSFNFTNGPDNPGASIVFRFDNIGGNFLLTTDGELFVRHFQSDDIFFCGGSQGFPNWTFNDVWQFFPEFPAVFRELAKSGEIPVFIYPPFPGGDFCDFLANDWLYKGTHTLVNPDNNFFWFLGVGDQDSFGWSAHGFVEDPSGNRFRYTEEFRIIVHGPCCDPADFTINVAVANIRVHPIRRN